MQKRRLWGYAKTLVVTALVIGGVIVSVPAFAQTSSSPNYKVTETEFNGGTSQQSCSGQYCARTTIGNATDGKKTTSPTAEFQEVTNDDPLLELIIEPGDSNLGVLTSEQTATKTTTVKVRSIKSGGYMLQIIGAPPKYNGHYLETAATPFASQTGKEQFGINLTTNTSPSVGTDPVQTPSGQGIFGVVEDGYKTANMFKYENEDVIAKGTLDGRTDYTISMVFNISSSTPAGKYTGDFAMILVPNY